MVPVAAVPHFRECLAATCPRREVFGRSLCGAGPGRDHGTYDQEGGDGDDLSTEHDPVDVNGGLPANLALLDDEGTGRLRAQAEPAALARP